jgi:tetratricopeptide (TPR) repeat protein
MADLAEVRKRLNENPGDAGALREAARYYLQEGYFKQAQQRYLQAVNFNPRLLPEIILDYEEKIEKEPARMGVHLSLAGFLLAADSLDSTILELEEILEQHPQNAVPAGWQVEAYNVLGRIYIKQEKIDDAIALLEKSIARGVKDVNLTETLAAAYFERGRIKEAVRFYEEILAQKPGDKHTLRILGELYTRLEDYLQAAQKYAAMFSDDPEVVREVIQRLEDLLRRIEGNIEIREILADIYMKTLDPDSAVGKLREIIRLESTKLEDAIQRLRVILRSYPDHPAAMLALAEALRRQGNYSEAVENYQQLIRIKPEFIEEAVRGYREVLEVCPEQVLARAYLGEAYLGQGKVLEALSEFGKMIEFDPSVAETVIRKCREILRTQPTLMPAHIVLGQAYLAKGDFQRAAVEAEGAIALDKNLTSAYLLLGEAYARLNLLRKAAAALRAALLLEPYNLQVHEKYRLVREKEIDHEIGQSNDHFTLAKLHLEKGAREDAIRELQAAQKDPARASAAYNLLGDIYRSEGRFDLAAAQYNRALESAAPELSRTIRFNLGTTYEAQGDVRKAVKIYEAIAQEDIDFGNLRKRVKQLKTVSLQCMRNRPLEAAIFDCGKKDIVALWGRENRPGERPGRKEEVSVSFGQEHNAEGFSFFMRGMFPAAEEEFSLAAQLDSNFAPALNNLGVALAKQGKLEPARLRLNEAVQIDPASPVFYNNLGVVYFLLGKGDLALTALEKSHALDPESSAVCLNLGDVHYSRKEVQKAVDFYRRVGAYDTLSDLARKRLIYKAP